MIAVPERVRVVMRLLSHAAETGAACPSNREIADRLSAASHASAVDVLHLLEAMNLIRIHRNQRSRIVTIVSTGKATAGRVGAAHRGRGYAA